MSLQAPIPAYLYRQYASDPDLPAFIDAYNAAAQYYLDWFNDNPLAYYPAQTGDLLDWTVAGIYGLLRTSLASPASPAVGPLATLELAQDPLAYYAPPTQTYYTLTDDVFQRIVTWNLYKADGNRFGMRWLKRRIMRFLLGVNGIDPGNVVTGTSNTMPISVTVASNILTVAIDQVLLSRYAQVTPGILQIFQLAFQAGQAGPLELPLQYDSYVCDIVTNLSAYASPSSLSIGGTATSQTTPNTSVTVLAGSGAYTYLWTRISGSSLVTIGSSTSATTDFSSTGMTPGDAYAAVFQCLVTDTVSSDTTTCQVAVSIACYATLAATISPSAASVTNATTSETTNSVTAVITGGSGSFSVSWTFPGGADGIVTNAPSAITTSFTGNGLSPSDMLSGTAQCAITDLITGLQVFPTCPVTISRVSLLSASVSPPSQTSSGTATTQTTGASTVSVTGGSGSGTYSISWSWVAGGAYLSIGSPASYSTDFTGSGMSPGNTYPGTAQVFVEDRYSQFTAVDVPVSISCTGASYAGTVTVGSAPYGFGYVGGFGTISPLTDTGGNTIQALFIDNTDGYLWLSIKGFSTDPGQAYINTLVIDGVSNAVSEAIYSYDPGTGTATWEWQSYTAFSFVINQTYPWSYS